MPDDRTYRKRRPKQKERSGAEAKPTQPSLAGQRIPARKEGAKASVLSGWELSAARLGDQKASAVASGRDVFLRAQTAQRPSTPAAAATAADAPADAAPEQDLAAQRERASSAAGVRPTDRRAERIAKTAIAELGAASAARAERVQGVIERVACICGISPASVRVDETSKTGCRITRTGIELMANRKLNEDICARARFGVRGSISLDEVDLMVACFVATRAQDFLLDDWRPDPPYGEGFSERTRRYLQSSIDDMAAYARMKERIAFARDRFDAYLSRAAAHAMSSEPLHLQFMRALRLYVLERDASIVVSPIVVKELGPLSEPAPFVAELADVVGDANLPYQERHERAARLIAEPFAKMLRIDERNMSHFDIIRLYDDEQSYGASKEAVEDENALIEEDGSALRAEAALAVVTSDNIDQLIADNNEPANPDAKVNLGIPTLTEDEGEIGFADETGAGYDDVVAAHRSEIDEIAEILMRIATPQEELSVPRYSPRRANAGARIHPDAIVEAATELATGQDAAVWQRVRRRIRPQNLQFQGLDVYLLLDVSVSMAGENAEAAAAMAACLVEGLDCALAKTAQDEKRDTMDVRTQLIAFGEGWAELTALEARHDADRKRFAFAQIAKPTSEQTLVAGALAYVRERAQAQPSRDIVCLVVSDGLFADGLQARKCVMGMPENAYIAHITIGDYSGLPLTSNFETIHDPAVLPDKLRNVLARRLRSE